jgi:carbonic anhydrase/acetyltransferase-like protein (isoleucine patch superfamily)
VAGTSVVDGASVVAGSTVVDGAIVMVGATVVDGAIVVVGATVVDGIPGAATVGSDAPHDADRRTAATPAAVHDNPVTSPTPTVSAFLSWILTLL